MVYGARKERPGYRASPVERCVLSKEKIPGIGDRHRGVEAKLGIFHFVEWDSQEGILVEKKEFHSASEEEKRKLATSWLGAPVPTRLVRVVIMANIRAS